MYDLLTIILITAGAYLLILIALYFFQRSLVYFPDRSTCAPKEAGVPDMKVIELNTKDGLAIHAWYSSPTKTDFPTLVYFHGNAGNIAGRAFIARSFLDMGYGLLLVTYRGYSGNSGSPSEEGLYIDARAAIEFLIKNGVQLNKIVLYGSSIGSAVAIQMATEYPVAAIILNSPFTSLGDVAAIHYAFFLPFKNLIKDKFDSLSKAANVHTPVLILHGKDDAIIPPELSRRLLAALQGTKEGIYIPGRGHNDLFEPELIHDFILRQNILPASACMNNNKSL